MFFFIPTPSADDRLLMLVQRRFYGEATQAETTELEQLLQQNPKWSARLNKIEQDLRQNRVFALTMKSFIKDLDETETEDLSAFMRTSRRNRELYESLHAALKHQAAQRLQRKVAPSE